jgi:hypothetical protein
MKRCQSCWLRSRLDPGFSADQSIAALLQLFPRPQAIRALPKDTTVEVSVAIYTRSGRPGLCLSSEVIHALAEIGARLDVDTYDLTGMEKP